MTPRIMITQLSDISAARNRDVNEGMARRRIEAQRGSDNSVLSVVLNAHHQGVFSRKGLISSFLLCGQIPVGVEGMRVARDKQDLPGSISFGQIGNPGSFRPGRRLTRSSVFPGPRRFLSRSGGELGPGFIAFQQDRWNF